MILMEFVLVRADRAVRAEAPEHALLAVALRDDEGVVGEDVASGDVVLDADGEVVDRLGGGHVVVDGLAHLRGEVLRADAVAAAEDERVLEGDDAFLLGLADRGGDVEVERVAEGAGFLDAVEDGDGLDRGGEREGEVLHRERAVQVHLDEADLLALLDKGVDGLMERVAAGAHRDDNVLGVGGADVVVELVLAAGELGELVHVLLDDRGRGLVVLVGDFAELEGDVGVRRRAAHRGMLGVEGAAAEVGDVVVVDHLADDVLRDLLDLLDLVGGAEAVEEVEEGDLGLKRGGVGDHRHVLGLLDGVRAEHREAGLAAGHDVALVAEDAEGVGGEGAGRDMEDGRDEFAGDLVHVRNHEEEALRGREGRRERTGRQRAVDRAGGAAFGLHLDDGGDAAPDVRLGVGCELVAGLGHRRGRGDRVDCGHF